MIDFFSNDDLRSILEVVSNKQELGTNALLNRHIAKSETVAPTQNDSIGQIKNDEVSLLDDRSFEEKKEDEDNLYSVDNFTV